MRKSISLQQTIECTLNLKNSNKRFIPSLQGNIGSIFTKSDKKKENITIKENSINSKENDGLIETDNNDIKKLIDNGLKKDYSLLNNMVSLENNDSHSFI